jgi:uncharacterized protein
MDKKYITAQTLLTDSLELALTIAESGFKPDLIVGVWRGGTPVAIAIQEALEFIGLDSDHIAIRTTSYTGIGERTEVKVQGLEYLVQSLNEQNSLLIVDDVFDTGLSIDEIIKQLTALCKGNLPEIKVATPYYKPANNQTVRSPDYYLHEETQWLVFPHELLGLSDSEIMENKPGIESVRERLLALRR